MILNDLLQNIEIIEISGDIYREVSGIVSDSRKSGDGSLFIAIKGVQVDGHQYIQNAINLGAKTIIHEESIKDKSVNITYIQVRDTADTIGKIATTWYGNPSKKIKLVGVTGTNGKTTTATLLYKMFRKFGYNAGLLSTVANYINEEKYPATHTTPDPINLNRMLSEMMHAGCEYVFMEVSSHAIHQKRISGLYFAGGIFTNLTQDHLDYHGTMAKYLKAKKTFFDELSGTAFALTNIDDKNGMVMLQNTKAKKYTYSVKSLADFKGRIIEKHFDGTSIEINGKELEVHFVGTFNVYNLLSVYGSAVLLGENKDDVLLTMSTLMPVSGRFETLRSPEGYTVIVDYAHTPDALKNVLEAIHGVLEGSGNLITVVGCGGNRDKTKRPIMAQEAAKMSDQLILTSDNPRFEEPDAIIRDMADGLDPVQLKKTLCITDRAQAIKTACAFAKQGDVILIAGKGHEDYQDVKGIKHHFDDKEEVLKIFGS